MWSSLTKQWRPNEMGMIEMSPVDDLLPLFKEVDPVVALRALAEILLHEDFARLDLLLKDDELTAHWRLYHEDLEKNHSDDEYAMKLEERISQQQTPSA